MAEDMFKKNSPNPFFFNLVDQEHRWRKILLSTF